MAIGRQGGVVGSMQWNVCFITDSMADLNLFYRGGEQVYPIYLYHNDGTRTVNFDENQLDALLSDIGPHCYVDFEDELPEDGVPDPVITAIGVLDYIYATLHSPKYRNKYKEFLKIDFPRIPKPTDIDKFYKLAEQGKQLRELHLMKSPLLNSLQTTYPESGSDEVEIISYKDGKVWINDAQHFGNVPEIAWNFYIGGYQPAQKWLKDRKDHKLSSNDIIHYQKIVKILQETDKIMQQIDTI